MNLQDYLHSIQGKSVAVIGIGVSNTPLIELLLSAGIAVTACDKKERGEFDGLADALEAKGAKLKLGNDYLKDLTEDIIFRTPGMRPDVPEFLAAKERGSEITSEMEVFFKVCPCPILAVTGSDGKTTTTSIIAGLMKKAGYHVYVGGNIGNPLLAEAGGMKESDFVVLELSSFQLLTMDDIAPMRAVLTNLAPNHLNVHKDMEEYVEAKANIFLHQGENCRVTLNYDNDITRSFAPRAGGREVFFSRVNPIEEGITFEDGCIVRKHGGKTEKVLEAKNIKIPGIHNVENYMAAISAVEGLVSDDVIREFAAEFGGVEHRIELVRELHGVRYYNDSIASSPSRTIAGLRSFPEKVIMLAGGKDKDIPYDELGPDMVEHVKLLILTGGDAPGSSVFKIRDAAVNAPGYEEGKPEIIFVDDFAESIRVAQSRAKEGDVVLMSPASTSFDKFKNFMERGKLFKKVVNELK